MVSQQGKRPLYCDQVEGQGERLFQLACKRDLESIVTKPKFDTCGQREVVQDRESQLLAAGAVRGIIRTGRLYRFQLHYRKRVCISVISSSKRHRSKHLSPFSFCSSPKPCCGRRQDHTSANNPLHER